MNFLSEQERIREVSHGLTLDKNVIIHDIKQEISFGYNKNISIDMNITDLVRFLYTVRWRLISPTNTASITIHRNYTRNIFFYALDVNLSHKRLDVTNNLLVDFSLVNNQQDADVLLVIRQDHSVGLQIYETPMAMEELKDGEHTETITFPLFKNGHPI